ncbi:helicase associated domain-containing protein [Streptomyces sp. NPDC001709]
MQGSGRGRLNDAAAEPSSPRPGSGAGRLSAGGTEGDAVLSAEPTGLSGGTAHRAQVEGVGHRRDLLLVQVQNPQVAELAHGAAPFPASRQRATPAAGHQGARTELRLGAWIGNQRSRAATLSPERVEQLSAIGMRWS